MATGTGSKKSSGASKKSSSAPRAAAPKRMSADDAATKALGHLAELTGRDTEGVTGLERTEEGWKVTVEVVELRRVPTTTDVLALYEVDVDGHGDLQGYRRLRRYARGETTQE
ncbi:MAG TPA: gas vesicle protein [Nocardioidaceae bacterium]|nr:gas vesicle protein [Nocardioidaceae bacterium]